MGHSPLHTASQFRILYLEDDADYRNAFASLLHKAIPNAIISQCPDLLTAQGKLRHQSFDLVITDWDLPDDINGKTRTKNAGIVCEAIRKDKTACDADVPIVVVSDVAHYAERMLRNESSILIAGKNPVIFYTKEHFLKCDDRGVPLKCANGEIAHSQKQLFNNAWNGLKLKLPMLQFMSGPAMDPRG